MVLKHFCQGLRLLWVALHAQIMILTLWILTQTLPYWRKAQDSFMNINEGSRRIVWNLLTGLVPYIQNYLQCQGSAETLHNRDVFTVFIAASGRRHIGLCLYSRRCSRQSNTLSLILATVCPLNCPGCWNGGPSLAAKGTVSTPWWIPRWSFPL